MPSGLYFILYFSKQLQEYFMKYKYTIYVYCSYALTTHKSKMLENICYLLIFMHIITFITKN